MTKQAAKPNQLLSETKAEAESADISKSPLWFTDLRRRAEIMVASQPSVVESASSEIDIESLFHELQVLQIELEMQNEELERHAVAEKSDYESHFHDTALKRKQSTSACETEFSFLQEQITHREREILFLVGRGATSREIAEQLFISIKTVELHRANMMKKLNTKNAATLARWAAIAEFMTVTD